MFEDTEFLYFYFAEYKKYFLDARVLYCDATYRVCSGGDYYQLLTLSTKVKVNGYEMFLPLVSVLMPNKMQKSYSKVFHHINSKLLGGEKLNNLQYLLTDWERGISAAFKKEFDLPNDFQERRCHLHWLRNFEKQAKKEHIWGELIYKTGLFNRFYNELKYVSFNQITGRNSIISFKMKNDEF